jgi:hypothetical protein
VGLLSKLVKILLVSGVLAFYFNYGRQIMPYVLPEPLKGLEFVADWLGLFVMLTAAYALAWWVGRRMES